MQPEQYDAWYQTRRGAWIGGVEYHLLDQLLTQHSGATVLDVGCGTGHFTRRFSGSAALGLLNRHSLLWFSKGRQGGSGAYRGAHWHTRREVKRLFGGQPARKLTLRTAIMLPGGGRLARWAEPPVERAAPCCGAFLAAAADVAPEFH